jgi:hypothetical protein
MVGFYTGFAAHAFVYGVKDRFAFRKAPAVDVIDNDFAAGQHGRAHAVPKDIAGKHSAARPQESDFRQESPSNPVDLNYGLPGFFAAFA